MGLNFFNPGARRGVWSTSGPGRFTPAKDPVPILQVAGRDPETVWKGTGKLASTGIGSMDRPVRSDSLYRLSYPPALATYNGASEEHCAPQVFPRILNTAEFTFSCFVTDNVTRRESSSGPEKRVVCYYTNWSVYRPGTAKFTPQNINPYLCTHLVYAFGGLTRENSLRPYDKYQDIEQGALLL